MRILGAISNLIAKSMLAPEECLTLCVDFDPNTYRHGRTKTTRYIVNLSYTVAAYADVMIYAAATGRIELLDHYKGDRGRLYCNDLRILSYTAAENGHLTTIKWLKREHGTIPKIEYAAKKGNIRLMRWILHNFADESYAAFERCVYVNAPIDALVWLLHTNITPREQLRSSKSIHGTNLKTLKWMIAQGASVCARVCYYAAQRGDSDILRFVAENKLCRCDNEFHGKIPPDYDLPHVCPHDPNALD